MFERLRLVWLPRLLFLATVAVAVGLAGVVFFSPYLETEAQQGSWPRLVGIFARDATVRRTSLASSVGLLVTACVFFRPGLFRSGGKKSRTPKQPPPVVGA